MEKNQQNPRKRIPRALSIAGSDSGGCAGIQADLKTFGALQVHGMSVITSITAQDTRRVHESSELPADLVARQIEAVLGDIGADSVKTGMLPTPEIISVVADKMLQFRVPHLVVDPVMVSTSGDQLISKEAVDALKERLFPLATLVTPNIHELQSLIGRPLGDVLSMKEAAKQLRNYGPKAILIKGGHLEDPENATDLYFDGESFLEFSGPRFDTKNTHGSGCTLSAAITAFLARDLCLQESVRRGKRYTTQAIQHSFSLGGGNGPLAHFFKTWQAFKQA